MRQGWCIGLRLLVQLRANNHKCCIFRLRQTKKRIIILDEAERIFIELDKKQFI